jgi:hypothetical protein
MKKPMLNAWGYVIMIREAPVPQHPAGFRFLLIKLCWKQDLDAY